ncbi:helix-turn-helix transcriptional regulator [Desulfobacterales bacterium HSG2]|nr:helix-turn-helix transcriptional regulator [Desulfobacterales bacterium HSG2]
MDNKNYPHRKLGNKLKELRGSDSKTDFAKKLGVALRTYLRYEKGERKVPDGLFKLAQMIRQSENDNTEHNFMIKRIVQMLEQMEKQDIQDIQRMSEERLKMRKLEKEVRELKKIIGD